MDCSIPTDTETAQDNRIPLTGLTRDGIARLLLETGESPGRARMRAAQIWCWLYRRGATRFSDMTDISADARQRYASAFSLARPAVARETHSADHTRKWLLSLGDGSLVETVHIPERDRGAVCISSQVGCTLNCRFCHTGAMRLVRNLTAGEIVGQVLVARDRLGEWPAPESGRLVSNIVVMGMGEPLYNLDAVVQALKICTDGEGIGISRRRITLSTAGVVPMMRRCGEETGVRLAVSLHAVTNELRDILVPLNRKYPLEELLEACRHYPGTGNARRITFEYVLLKDVNDTPADARRLVSLLRGIPAKVNLIPFNPWEGSGFETPSLPRIRAFSDIVSAGGLSSPVRRPRGRDIMAACGQLSSASLPVRKAHRTTVAGHGCGHT